MSKSLKIILISIVLLGVSITQWRQAFTQESNERYYRSTGHYIRGEFLDYYESVQNAELLYGFPITEAFYQPNTGQLVQYFEKTRFELITNALGVNEVHLSHLGEFIYEPVDPFPVATNSNECELIGQHQVCLAFLSFYKQNDGATHFGKPISPMELRGGRIVQYFESARLEYFPEGNSIGQFIKISNLGRQYFYVIGEDPKELGSAPPPSLISEIPLKLQVYVFPAKAVVSSNGVEPVYVVVLDQNLRPVDKATIGLTLTYPSGEERSFALEPTDPNGITSIDILVDQSAASNGIAIIEAEGTFSIVKGKNISSFRISSSNP